MTTTEVNVTIGEKFRRFWKSITKQETSSVTHNSEPPVNPPMTSSLFRPNLPKENAAIISTRVLEFSRERRGKLEAPNFEGPLDSEYRCVASTLCEADQISDGDCGTVLLYCYLQANVHDVVFLWMKDDQEIYPSDRIIIINQQSASFLRINYPKLSDSGYYTCIAANPEGRCETKTRLIVAPPTLVSSSSEQPLSPISDNDVPPSLLVETPPPRPSRSLSLQVSDNRRSKRYKKTGVPSLDESQTNRVKLRSKTSPNSPVTTTSKSISSSNKTPPDEVRRSTISVVNSPEQSDLNSDSDSQDIRALPECDQPSPLSTINKDQTLETGSVSKAKVHNNSSDSGELELGTPTPSETSQHGLKFAYSTGKDGRDSRVTLPLSRPSSALGFTPKSPTRQAGQLSSDGDDDKQPTFNDSRLLSKRRQTHMFSSVRDSRTARRVRNRSAAFDRSLSERQKGVKSIDYQRSLATRKSIHSTVVMVHSPHNHVGRKSATLSDGNTPTKVSSSSSSISPKEEHEQKPTQQQLFHDDSTRFATSPRNKTHNQHKMARLKSSKEKKLQGKTVHDSAMFMVQQLTSDDELVLQSGSEPETPALTPIQTAAAGSISASPTDSSQNPSDDTKYSPLLLKRTDDSSPKESTSLVLLDEVTVVPVSINSDANETSTNSTTTTNVLSDITTEVASDLTKPDSSELNKSVSNAHTLPPPTNVVEQPVENKPITAAVTANRDWMKRLASFFQRRPSSGKEATTPPSLIPDTSDLGQVVHQTSTPLKLVSIESDKSLVVKSPSLSNMNIVTEPTVLETIQKSNEEIISEVKPNCTPDRDNQSIVDKYKQSADEISGNEPCEAVSDEKHIQIVEAEQISTNNINLETTLTSIDGQYQQSDITPTDTNLSTEKPTKTEFSVSSVQEEILSSKNDESKPAIESNKLTQKANASSNSDMPTGVQSLQSKLSKDIIYSNKISTLKPKETPVESETITPEIKQNPQEDTIINQRSPKFLERQLAISKSEHLKIPLEFNASKTIFKNNTPKQIGVKSGFVKQAIQKLETHGDQTQLPSPQLRIRSLVKQKSTSLPPPAPPSQSTIQTHRASTTLQATKYEPDHNTHSTTPQFPRPKSIATKTSNEAHQTDQPKVTRSSFIDQPERKQIVDPKKPMDIELEFVALNKKELTRPQKQSVTATESAKQKPTTTDVKGLRFTTKTKEPEEKEHVTITKRPTLALSLLQNAEKVKASNNLVGNTTHRCTTSGDTLSTFSNTSITSTAPTTNNSSATPTKPKSTSPGFDSVASMTSNNNNNNSSFVSSTGDKIPTVIAFHNNTILPLPDEITRGKTSTTSSTTLATVSKSPTPPKPLNVTPTMNTAKPLERTAQSSLPTQPHISKDRLCTTDKSLGNVISKQEIEAPISQTKRAPVMSTQLLPVVKLMESLEGQTTGVATCENHQASVPKRPQVGHDEIDEDDDQRVEYPSKVKTQRDTDPTKHFETIGHLGSGKFGRVVICKEIASGKQFASKTFRTTRLPRHNGELMEVAVLRAVGKHPQIAYMHAAYETKMQCTIVTELVTGGALYKRIQEEGTLDEAITVQIIRQVLLGLRHLQTCQVLHCDLKPENLVMRKPRGYELKIIDFGLACFYKPNQTPRAPAGTLTYLAPETQNYDPQSYATDLWSVAVIAYEILSGVTPFEIPYDGDPNRQLSSREISLNITKVRYTFDDEGIVDASREAKDFIKRILVRDPKQRPTVHECLEHAWIAMPDTKRSKVARTVSLKRHSSHRIPRNASIRTPIRASSLRKC